MARLRFGLDLVEGPTGHGVPGTIARERLPAPDDGVAVERVDLYPIAASAHALGRDHRGAAAEETVEHDVAARRAVEDRIGDERDRLHRRMQREQIAFVRRAAEGIRAAVVPNIRTMATVPTQLDVVPVRPAAVLEDKDELVLTSVEATHSGIVFDPDADVLELRIGCAAGGQELVHVAPIHAHEMNRAVSTAAREIC